jgi:hypothetical protein
MDRVSDVKRLSPAFCQKTSRLNVQQFADTAFSACAAPPRMRRPLRGDAVCAGRASCATLTANGAPVMDVLFDATGMARSFVGVDVLYHDRTFREETRHGLPLPGIDSCWGRN